MGNPLSFSPSGGVFAIEIKKKKLCWLTNLISSKRFILLNNVDFSKTSDQELS